MALMLYRNQRIKVGQLKTLRLIRARLISISSSFDMVFGCTDLGGNVTMTLFASFWNQPDQDGT